jgi:RNA polymerase sigma-70 factor (ECF subfamily)
MDIARQIRTNPDEGIRRLAAELGPGLRAFALRLCGSREDADDLYVRTLEAAVAHIAEQRGPGFGAWLRAICLNLHRSDLRRRDQPVPAGALHEALADEAPSPLEATIARADAETVRAALLRLPERCRDAVLLRYWEGLSHQEIAAALGVAEGTAKSILFRAREQLRVALEPLRKERNET